MSEEQTHHAMLVVWGEFAEHIGLIERIEAIPIHQKTVHHSPQNKILAFLIAILGGLAHLQDWSTAAHPIAKDQVVAHAWQQEEWSDYSGISRCLSALTETEAQQILAVLEAVSQPLLDNEVMLALIQQGELVYDGDLTGRVISNTSTSYPGAAYGHMGDAVGFGYQAAMGSLHSPTYGRLWLSSRLHPGDVLSCTQDEAIVRAAEAKTGLQPLRRTELLKQRIEQVRTEMQRLQQKVDEGQAKMEALQAELASLPEEIAKEQAWLAILEERAAQPERHPNQQLGRARRRLPKLQKRQVDINQRMPKLDKDQQFRQEHLQEQIALEQELCERLLRFEQDNLTNVCPIDAVFRLDAGFGTREGVALQIEMGYEVFTKPYSDWLTPRLRRMLTPETQWTRVGENAEMTAWKDYQPSDFPYPVDVGLERFYTGKTQQFGTLLHYGRTPVTQDLPAWFHRYNARQTIEAGIKEGKGVFQMHHLKVRSALGIALQEQFAVFAANFVRWAARWLAQDCLTLPNSWLVSDTVKSSVQVAAHTSAWVSFQDQGTLLRFTDYSIYAGKSLSLPKDWAIQLALPFARTTVFDP